MVILRKTGQNWLKWQRFVLGGIVAKQKNSLKHILTVIIAILRISSGKKQTSWSFFMNGWVVESSETQLQLEVRLEEC